LPEGGKGEDLDLGRKLRIRGVLSTTTTERVWQTPHHTHHTGRRESKRTQHNNIGHPQVGESTDDTYKGQHTRGK